MTVASAVGHGFGGHPLHPAVAHDDVRNRLGPRGGVDDTPAAKDRRTHRSPSFSCEPDANLYETDEEHGIDICPIGRKGSPDAFLG